MKSRVQNSILQKFCGDLIPGPEICRVLSAAAKRSCAFIWQGYFVNTAIIPSSEILQCHRGEARDLFHQTSQESIVTLTIFNHQDGKIWSLKVYPW